MRSTAFLLAALIALSAFSAGCASEDEGPEPTVDTPAPMANATLPAAIHATETVMGSADPMNFVDGTICSSPTAQCFEYPFTVEGNATADATLTWAYPANDFDLYVMEGETVALNGASDVTAGPGTMEHVSGSLPSGDYRVVVVAWGVAQDTFDLSVEFS